MVGTSAEKDISEHTRDLRDI